MMMTRSPGCIPPDSRLTYPARVHPDEGAFWVEFPDFPDATACGTIGDHDPAAAAAQCLAGIILLRVQEGQPLPEPSPIQPGDLAVSPRLPPEYRRVQIIETV